MIGQTISHYRILNQLGEGGMGVVYLAEDISLNTRVAVTLSVSRRTDGGLGNCARRYALQRLG